MINIKKVAHQIKFDGMYNTVYSEVQEKLDNLDPSVDEIEQLITDDEYYIWEYKELNRYGELSSVHAKKLDIKDDESIEAKEFKTKLNDNVQQLKNLENFEVDSKNSAYSIWIGSIGVMVIFMVHNYFALFSDLYNTHENWIYFGYAIILGFTYWGYKRTKANHENQHILYKDLHKETRNMIKEGFEQHYFTHEEFFIGITTGDDEFFKDTTH